MKIGLFGGSFNPVHNAHLWVSKEILRKRIVDEVWFIPAKHPPHKDETYIKFLASTKHRLGMLRIALRNQPKRHYKTIELKMRGMSYTYKTVRKLKKEYPRAEFFFIIGSDLVKDLTSWYRIGDLIKEISFLAVMRKNIRIPPRRFLEEYNVRVIELPEEKDISATDIRKRIYEGRTVKNLLPGGVYDYIIRNEVYPQRGIIEK